MQNGLFTNIEGSKRTACIIGRGGNEIYPARNDRGAYGGGEKFVMKAYLLISRLRIHNANAMSSTLTIGVPAMTAWLGAVHALERKLGERREPALEGIRLVKTAVSYHKTNLQIYKGLGDYVNSLVGTANPLNEKGERPSFIEDARIHLSISLLIEVEG